MVADVIVVMEVQDAVVLSGSSLSFAAVVATMVLADLAAVMVAVATIAVALSGFYLSFAAVVATIALADVEIPAANFICKSHRRRCMSTPFSYFFYFEYINVVAFTLIDDLISITILFLIQTIHTLLINFINGIFFDNKSFFGSGFQCSYYSFIHNESSNLIHLLAAMQ